ncbi:hypothetical protein ACFOPX_05890 [Helicobacter baculiformis]|uniref:Uncharacterized protein n=1 Tax=Helicobacter baculiformis TaxID=427351 RepID=A0ABV7ZLL7_9HELI|nr:hypothetical protein [Helicobacter baculiformis]
MFLDNEQKSIVKAIEEFKEFKEFKQQVVAGSLTRYCQLQRRLLEPKKFLQEKLQGWDETGIYLGVDGWNDADTAVALAILVPQEVVEQQKAGAVIKAVSEGKLELMEVAETAPEISNKLNQASMMCLQFMVELATRKKRLEEANQALEDLLDKADTMDMQDARQEALDTPKKVQLVEDMKKQTQQLLKLLKEPIVAKNDPLLKKFKMQPAYIKKMMMQKIYSDNDKRINFFLALRQQFCPPPKQPGKEAHDN